MTKTSPQSPKQKSAKNSSNIILIILAVAAGFFGGLASSSMQQESMDTPESRQQIISTEADAIAEAAKTTSESVVSIDVTSQALTQNFFGYAEEVERASAGTGVILSTEGVIVTNKHVVPTGTSEVSVTLFDGTILDAEVVARDPRNDIAFIKITDRKGKSLKAAVLGDSTDLKVGEKVIAIGNALGEFQNTVTSGIISGYGRDITAGDGSGSEALTNLIQTDAAINMGNSGGPLVNLSGEVIGINTAITGSSSGQSLGFAIPVNDIKAQITSVLEKGKIERPYLGVRYRNVSERLAYIYNLPVASGAYLMPSEEGAEDTIIKDSPADKAGLKEKDIILKINEDEISESNSLAAIIGKYKVGEQVNLSVRRGNDTINLTATLEVAPEE
jgi:serine protease Do